MTLNAIGPAAALTAFLSIWLGHVAVRAIEARVAALWVPMAAAVALGIGAEAAALASPNPVVSGVLGIAGITLLWDALEFKRQDKRVARGHAPANPANSRHRRILEQQAAGSRIGRR